jgi:hypothetical protein
MGAPTPPLGKQYKGRAAVMPMNISIDNEAAGILRKNAAGPRAYGRFISRLLYEYESRAQERLKLRDRVLRVIEEE